LNGRRIAIERDHIGTGRQNGRGVAASTKGAIENDLAGGEIEARKNLWEKNRNVTGRSAIGIRKTLALIRHHSASPL
jgi:hypothetical protein